MGVSYLVIHSVATCLKAAQQFLTALLTQMSALLTSTSALLTRPTALLTLTTALLTQMSALNVECSVSLLDHLMVVGSTHEEQPCTASQMK